MNWISIKDKKLPENINVLVADFNGFPRISISKSGIFADDYDKQYNKLDAFTDKNYDFLSYFEITHWMYISDILLPQCSSCKDERE